MCLLTYCIQVKNHPKKLWVEKSNNHRGIHIKSPNGNPKQILHKLAVVIFFLKAHTWSVGFCLLLFNKWLEVIISIFSINFVYFFFL